MKPPLAAAFPKGDTKAWRRDVLRHSAEELDAGTLRLAAFDRMAEPGGNDTTRFVVSFR